MGFWVIVAGLGMGGGSGVTEMVSVTDIATFATFKQPCVTYGNSFKLAKTACHSPQVETTYCKFLSGALPGA